MRRLFFLLITLLLCSTIYAQSIITGRVTSSEDESPLPYVSVFTKGTNNHVFTNENGEYSIKVNGNEVLVFSLMGFVTKELQIEKKSIINVILDVDSKLLDETIVVAYGTVKKGSYSGSATVIKESAMKDAPVPSFEQVLSGKAAGVQVSSYSGQPGSEAQISVRGFGSFNAGNSPLYVIDGVPATSGDYGSQNISTSAMSFLNPNTIESITILKDAAAASLYGSRASNGVVLITTKKGKAGKLTSTFKANAGLSYFAYDNYPLASDSQAEALHREAWFNYGTINPTAWSSEFSTLENYVDAKVQENFPAKDESKYIYKDWEDVLFRIGVAQDYEYSLSGGNEKSKIYASIGYTNHQGIVLTDNLERISTTINGEAQVLDNLKLGGTFQYSWQDQTGHQEGQTTKDNPFYQWKVLFTERWPYAYSDGTLYMEPFNPSYSTVNPVPTYSQQINDAVQNRLILKGWAQLDITEWLSAKTILSSDWLNVHDRFGWLYGHPNYYAYSDIGGYMSDRIKNVNRVVSSTTLNFNKSWGDHHVTALLGWEAERENYFISRFGKIDFSYAGATESIFGTTPHSTYAYRDRSTLLSLVSSLNYDYQAKYYITGTYRRDGSSRLAPSSRWGDFWSLSGSWRFSNEKFASADWLNDGKLRASVGTSGTLPSDYYGYMAVYDYTKYGSLGASYPGNIANESLTWEKNQNWNIGVDATIFDRYTFSAEYFDRKTTDLLLDATVPSTTGFSSMLMNIGAMRNSGWELSLNVNIIDKEDFSLSVGANWATTNNEILSLSEEGETILSWPHIWQAGYSVYQYYTRNYLGVNPDNGAPLYAEGSFFEAGEIVNQDVVLKDGTIVKSGSAMPTDGYNYAPVDRQSASSMIIEGKDAIADGFGGFSADLRWKALSFSMAWAYKYGHYVWDNGTDLLANDGASSFGLNILESQVDTWSPSNVDATIPQRIANNNQGGYYESSRFIKEGDYLRLKNVTLSYNLSDRFTQKMRVNGARVFLSGSNLLTFSGLDIDPEIQASGYYNFYMPALRTVSLGVEVSF